MECKNCHESQPNDFSFCPVCGAKVIHHKLTVKNLSHEITEKVFNLDGNLIKTFRHLFTRPEDVLLGYVNGIRRRYLNPIAYFTIALTLSGLQLYILRKFYADSIDWDVLDQGMNPVLADKLMNVLFDLNSFLFIIYIPVFALAGWLTMNKKSFVPTEHVVFFIYTLAHWSIVSFPYTVLTLVIAPEYYMTLAFPSLALMVGYSIYAMQRINWYSAPQLILRSGVFSILVLMGYFGIILLLYAGMFSTGYLTIEDFKTVP